MRSIALLLACLLTAGVNGQAAPDQPDGQSTAPAGASTSVFRSSIEVVPLNVVVTDFEQKLVSGLAQSDFVVREDGVPQDISFFANSNVPLDLALLLDTSASMSTQMAAVRAAARGFIGAVRGVDRVMVVDIKKTSRTLHPLNGDVEAALQAIAATEPSGGTGLYNGLYITLKELTAARRAMPPNQARRQAVVLLSDGHDTSSLLSFDDVMELARSAGIATYTINLQRPAGRALQRPLTRVLSDAEYSLKELARETGARAFFPEDVRDLAGVYGDIANELSSQYALAYVPKNGSRDGAFRRISVELPGHPGHRARTRAGYTGRRAG